MKKVFIVALAMAVCFGGVYAQGGKKGAKAASTTATEVKKESGSKKGKFTYQPFERSKNYNVEGSYIKLSINAYSFTKGLNDYVKGRDGDAMTLFDLVDFCAANKVDAVDATGYFFPGYSFSDQSFVPNDDYVYALKKYAYVRGVDISGTGVNNNFAHPDAEYRKRDVQKVKNWIDVASKLGAPVIRIFSGPVPEGYENKWDEVAAWMVPCMKEVAEYGAKRGVIVGVQNHGDMMATAEQTIKVLNMVDNPWFGLILDTGYFQEADKYKAMEQCAKYAVNWQIKESPTGRQNPTEIDLDKVMEIVKGVNYRGYLPIETLSIEGRPYVPEKLLPEFLDKVRKAMEKAGIN